jgi:hypothetical protein
VAAQVASATTSASGTISVRTTYRSAGSYTLKVLKVAGHADATSQAVPIA